MNRKIISIYLLLLIAAVGHAQSRSIDDVLRTIEANNKQLQANKQETISAKLEAKTDNNLPDPSVSYGYLWGQNDSSDKISELTISQSFDFPTLYSARSKMNRLKMGALDSQAATFRRDLLLQAKEICLDIILLRQQKEILDQQLDIARGLSSIYQERLEKGDTDILQTNKINLELLNVITATTLNETALRNKLQELSVLNGNEEITFENTSYPVMNLPEDYETLHNQVVSSDISLYALDKQAAASQAEIKVNRSQWLPKLELGYRRDTDAGNPFNGIEVGFSIPLFENRNKVKMAKAQALNVSFQRDNKLMEIESELLQQYREAATLRTSMQQYEKAFANQSYLELLKQALDGGEISMIEYFVEVSVVYESKLSYLQLQNQYHKLMARIYKNQL